MQYAFVIAMVLVSFALSIAQLVVLPVLALIMLWDPRTAYALMQAWLVQFVSLSAPFVVPFIMQRSGASVRWTIYNTLDDQGQTQGMKEPQVAAVYNECGWAWKTWYWLAGRNVCYGFANLLRPNYDFVTASFELDGSTIVMTWDDGTVRQYSFPALVGPRIEFGYKISAYLNSVNPIVRNPHIDPPDVDVGGVPFFTMRLK